MYNLFLSTSPLGVIVTKIRVGLHELEDRIIGNNVLIEY